jgi:23S rRNA pseudouridine1911/1915/1917 synthase
VSGEDEPDIEPDGQEPDSPGVRVVALGEADAGGRLDKTLAAHLTELSRSRIQALMAEGQVSRDGVVLTDPSVLALAASYQIVIPPPVAAEPAAEDIPLDVLFEDPHLIVINKPAGMAVHPGPGVESGTLVNALLHHCGDQLSGIGGVARPGIVHRIDKDTSGVLVAAKSEPAHHGLARLFAAHDIDRLYVALTRGAPKPAKATLVTRIGRSPSNRKKMAVLKAGGREAVTHYEVEQVFGPAGRPAAARVACRLETGRTHQIRVHLASAGAPCLGDPLYGSGKPNTAVQAAIGEAGLARQALHAAVLGFEHPITKQKLRFEAPLPADMAALVTTLESI